MVVLALVIWLVVALTGGDDPDQNPEPAAAEVSTSATTTAADASADAASASTTRSGEASASSGSRGAGGSAAEDADDDSSTTTTSAAPVPPGQCSDQSLAVRVTSDEPNYRVGSEPDFTIVITNIGTSPCERDLGAGLQQVLVYSLDGNERLWANTDCFPESTADIRSLDPGDQAAYSVKWSATTSEPGCQAPREPVGPGAYTVVGQLGGLRSVPEPFNITP
ncbi:hypothetical protein RDE2_04550 [Rhodococcus sp. RDE2]|uniref:Uncharacterized protein n=1 Tax=Rhodococcus rhodochrous J45 TaxID=935266 RepID=A0A562DJ64_RHORH|nr:hypothetical protein L618_000500000200 [Rhodococcus rhodochrous J45]BDB58661.1 hypothetical protein RDE2_04550 [Rhodococcus sp. RDE2]